MHLQFERALAVALDGSRVGLNRLSPEREP